MAVLIPNKLLFLANPRTASTAMTAALKHLPGAVWHGIKHHAPVEDIEQYNGELTCTTVRNPWDTVATWNVLIRNKNFKKFINGCTHSFYAKKDCLFWLHQDADVFLHYENLDEELNNLLVSLDLPTVTLQVKNVTKGKQPWRTYYDEETFNIVKTRFQEEIEKYGYSHITWEQS